ncbi:MAG: hypothetical protein A4E66_00037 [Syntrophus sp. PtaB.Bin001]|nr:MAG: hypothetical protein A4E66_00037 [Syntrophus sp. PtaB.Bin001]
MSNNNLENEANLFTEVTGKHRVGNGLFCRVRNDQIDTAICSYNNPAILASIFSAGTEN